MTLSTVTLKWDLTDLIQAGLAATLSITPTAQMSDTADHVLIPPVARTYTFTGGTGQLAGIVANDNAAILPAGAGYLISVTSAAGQVIVPQFQAQLLFANAVAGVLWLDQLAIVPVVATSYQYLPVTGLAGVGYTAAGALSPKVVTLAQSGGVVAVNAALGNVFRLPLTASGWTLSNPTGYQDGEAIRVRLIQDATGSRTLSYGSAWDFGAAGTPVLTTSPGKTDYLVGEWNADANGGAGAACVTLGPGF